MSGRLWPKEPDEDEWPNKPIAKFDAGPIAFDDAEPIAFDAEPTIAKWKFSTSPKSAATEPRSKPSLTREQYHRARAVLDALPPGLYCHCHGCGGWFRATDDYGNDNGNVAITRQFSGPTLYRCRRCAP